jgi:hypothetical protein
MSVQFPFWIIPLAIIGGFFALILVVAMWEKYRIDQYTVPVVGAELSLTEYGEHMNREARRHGYIYKGICHDARGSIYKSRFDFWISPDSVLLARVSCGTIGRLPNARVDLFTQLDDGRCLQSTDMKGETDFSGLTDLQIWPHYQFAKLVERHFARIKDQGYTPVPFSNTPLRDLLAFRLRRAERLVDQGDAWFIDDNKMIWKYTLKGALTFYFRAVWAQPARRAMRRVGLSS